MRKYILFFFMIIMLTGCITKSQAPDPLQVQLANYGKLPEDYKQGVKNHFYYRLKDPYSAHYKFFEPYKGYSWVMNVPVDKEQLMFGWIIPVSVNAKNGFGAYAGATKVMMIYSNGQYHELPTLKEKVNITRVP
ncbi:MULTISPECIES: membrane lipoprotein lipid attachment site-containing protein [Dickeya]|nr:MULTISPECIES: membrane lipoprotein lipid attachment site-containing protein [Dickeya]